jgi:hypothetical protein
LGEVPTYAGTQCFAVSGGFGNGLADVIGCEAWEVKHVSLALGGEHGKLDADLRTSAFLGTPSVHSIHDYYPFALADGGRLGPMAVELVDRRAILVAARRFPSMTLVHLCPYETFRSLSAFSGGCAARVNATSIRCSSWYFWFLSP